MRNGKRYIQLILFGYFIENVDALSDQYRNHHNGVLYPTSYADQMDRALKSLGKDLGIAITVDLVNTQAIKVGV